MENSDKNFYRYIDRAFPFFAIALVPILVGFAPFFLVISQIGKLLSLSYEAKNFLVKLFLVVSVIWYLGFIAGFFTRFKSPFIFVNFLKNKPLLSAVLRVLCAALIGLFLYWSFVNLGSSYNFDPNIDHAW